MRRELRLRALIALLLAAVGVTVAWASPSDGGGHDGGRVEVIHAVRHTVKQTNLDLDRSGGTPPSTQGDQNVFTADFFVGEQRIGFDGGFCTLVREPAVFQCVATNSLPKGQVTAQGLLNFEEGQGPYHLAITGGTGAYRTARGQVRILIRGEPQGDLVTFWIIR